MAEGGIVRTRRQRLLDSDEARTWLTTLTAAVLVMGAILGSALAERAGVALPDAYTQPLQAGLLPSAFIGAGLTWAAGSAVYAGVTIAWFGRMDSPELHDVLRTSSPGVQRPTLRQLLFGSGGSATSLATSHAVMGLVLVVGLANLPELRPWFWVRLLAVAVVTMSWLMVLVTQALAYARLRAHDGPEVIAFAGTAEPLFEDYLALASGISTMLGHTDVATSGRRARRLVRNHGLISFGFNSMVVAALATLLIT